MRLGWGVYCCANRNLTRLTMSPTLNNKCGIIKEHYINESNSRENHMITRLMLVLLFLPQAGVRSVEQPWHAQLGPGRCPPAQTSPGQPSTTQMCPVWGLSDPSSCWMKSLINTFLLSGPHLPTNLESPKYCTVRSIYFLRNALIVGRRRQTLNIFFERAVSWRFSNRLNMYSYKPVLRWGRKFWI